MNFLYWLANISAYQRLKHSPLGAYGIAALCFFMLSGLSVAQAAESNALAPAQIPVQAPLAKNSMSQSEANPLASLENAPPPQLNKMSQEPAAFDPLSTAYLLKLVSSLLLVLALMFAVVWILKRTGRFAARAGHYPLQVLTQLPIGTRERVLLIAVGDRQMLIGVAPGQISALGWVDPPLKPDASAPPKFQDLPFARLLQQQLAVKNKPKAAQSSADSRAARPQS